MGKCRKASKRRSRPECTYCQHTVRRGLEQHLRRCHAAPPGEFYEEWEVQYFGESWGAPVNEEVAQVATPVGDLCLHCHLPIQDGDQGYLIPYLPTQGSPRLAPRHRKCLAREIGPWT